MSGFTPCRTGDRAGCPSPKPHLLSSSLIFLRAAKTFEAHAGLIVLCACVRALGFTKRSVLERRRTSSWSGPVSSLRSLCSRGPSRRRPARLRARRRAPPRDLAHRPASRRRPYVVCPSSNRRASRPSTITPFVPSSATTAASCARALRTPRVSRWHRERGCSLARHRHPLFEP